MRPPMLHARAAAALILSLALFTAVPSGAQSGRTWVALDSQPAGTPASVVFNVDASSMSESVLDVGISGFWVQQKTGSDGRLYQSLEVPGLPGMGQHGAPNLPVCRFDLGVTNGGDAAVMLPPLVTSNVALPGYLVWPAPFEATLHDGSPEVFVRSDSVYAIPGFWPASDGVSPVPTHTLLGFLPTASCEAYPFHWDPISGLLNVATHVRYRFHHDGPGLTLPLTTPAQRNVVSHLVANWQTVGPSVVIDTRTYSGYYLIVCRQVYQQVLQPLADQKTTRGLKVSWRFVDDIGPVCMNIRNAIGAWFNTTPKGAEHYCLLVGDVDDIPICNGPQSDEDTFGVPSDDPYGTPFAMNNDRQIMVGRLSPQGAADLGWDVDMILTYEDHPVQDSHYGDVLLVAHGGVIGASDDIWPYQEKIRTAAYASPPSFYTLYGNVLGVDNNKLKQALQGPPRGLVDYFGHGFVSGWGCWDVSCQNFTSSDVALLSLAPDNPIVWSIACESGAIQTSDCFGENWTARYGLGALAFYGSSVVAHAYPSIDLNQNLFFAVYSQDIRVQGFTYFDAEYRMENVRHSGDSWKYLLLGDPEMTIRTTAPQSPWVSMPWVERAACGAGGCPDKSDPRDGHLRGACRRRAGRGVAAGLGIARWWRARGCDARGWSGGGECRCPGQPLHRRQRSGGHPRAGPRGRHALLQRGGRFGQCDARLGPHPGWHRDGSARSGCRGRPAGAPGDALAGARGDRVHARAAGQPGCRVAGARLPRAPASRKSTSRCGPLARVFA